MHKYRCNLHKYNVLYRCLYTAIINTMQSFIVEVRGNEKSCRAYCKQIKQRKPRRTPRTCVISKASSVKAKHNAVCFMLSSSCLILRVSLAQHCVPLILHYQCFNKRNMVACILSMHNDSSVSADFYFIIFFL